MSPDVLKKWPHIKTIAVIETASTNMTTGKVTNSDYGRLVPSLTVKAELLQQPDGHFMLTRITNGEDIFYPIVKGIEDYWTLQGWQ